MKENFWHYFDGFNLQRSLCDVSFLQFQVEIVNANYLEHNRLFSKFVLATVCKSWYINVWEHHKKDLLYKIKTMGPFYFNLGMYLKCDFHRFFHCKTMLYLWGQRMLVVKAWLNWPKWRLKKSESYNINWFRLVHLTWGNLDSAKVWW